MNKIKKLAISSGLVKDPEVSFFAEGYGNYVYLIQENDQKLVLRIKKSNEKQFIDSLEKEYAFLRYFESKGITFCPRALFYNKKDNFLIENFIEGEKISQNDLSNEQIDLFAKQLYDLFQLSSVEFFDFCKNHKLKKFEYSSPIDSLKTYGFKRFNEADKKQIPEDVIVWVQDKLNKNLESLNKRSSRDGHIGFAWGDVQSEMIIDDSGGINFYDFEHARISQSSDLSYIKIHGIFSDSQFDYLIDRYSHYSKKSKKVLLKEINTTEKIIRVNDVVWAVRKWADTQEEEFKKMTYERIKSVEKL